MLVLKLKKDQKIRIGSDIELVVIESTGGRVRLGIEAPETLKIIRNAKHGGFHGADTSGTE